MFWPSVFLLKTTTKFTTFRTWENIFVLRWGVVKLIKNPFIKIKRLLMLTNFILVMYKIAEKY